MGFPGHGEEGKGGRVRIAPLYGNVLLRRVEEPQKGRIIHPDMAKKKSQKAQVVAVGPGRYNTAGVIMPCKVKAGDFVLISEWAGYGTEVDSLGEEMLLCKEENILAIVTEEATIASVMGKIKKQPRRREPR